jgi:2-aminoadipate transaminase
VYEQFSRRVADLHASPIREILSVIDRPGMVSFAGGLPAPETFPELTLDHLPRALLQYGASEGEAELRERIAADLGGIGLPCSPEQVLVLSGSQQGIDLVAKLFIDPGTLVAVESPTYLAALQVFRFFGASFSGFDPQQPAMSWSGAQRPAFVYAIPTFQNLTGRCYTTDERVALARSCDAHGVPLFEDDPYRDLAYDPCDRTPGLRLGFLVASPDLVVYLTRLKQATDLHSSRLSRWLVLQQLRDARRAQRLEQLLATYRGKRDFFAAALERHLGDAVSWEMPPGGLFFWLTLARSRDTRTLLPEAIRRGVAFMPGEPFYPAVSNGCGALRLNFNHADAAQTERGLATLEQLIAE